MKAGWKVINFGLDNKHSDYIEVANFKALNEVAHFCFNSVFKKERNKNTVGVWKVKK